MTRFLTAVLAALLMTATLAMPAEAAGKPGLIQTVSVTGAGPTFPGCYLTVTVNFNATRKTGDRVYVGVWRTENGVRTGGPLASPAVDILSDDTQQFLQPFPIGLATGVTYVIYVAVQKPKTGPGWVSISHVLTNEFTYPSAVCTLAGQTIGYTR